MDRAEPAVLVGLSRCLLNKGRPFGAGVGHTTVRFRDVNFSRLRSRGDAEVQTLAVINIRIFSEHIECIGRKLLSLKTKSEFLGTIFYDGEFRFIMAKSARPNRAALQRIADALGVPVDRFFTDRFPVDADECLYLWSRIRTEGGTPAGLESPADYR